MSQQIGIGYPVKKDTFLPKGTLLHFVTDNNKFWFAENRKQITHPRKGNKVKGNPNWLSIKFKRIKAIVR